MSPQPQAQPINATGEELLRAEDVDVQPLSVDEALHLPALNGHDVICRLWQISASHFYRLNKQGAFDFLKVIPPVGPHCFSGVLIARYLCREPLYIPSFGRKR